MTAGRFVRDQTGCGCRIGSEWPTVLGRLTDDELDVIAPFPWQGDPERTVAHMIAWVSSELMKNTAEIGQLRLLRAASPGEHDFPHY